MNRVIISFLFLTILFSACKHNTSLNNNQMLFNIDTSLLSKKYYDTTLKIEFKTPISLVEIDIKNNKNIADNDSVKYKGLLYYFVDTSDNKSALMIYDIRKLETYHINKILESPVKFLNQNKNWDTIVSDTFSYNKYKIHQLMFQNKKFIAFNLYYSLNNKYIFYTAYTSDINKYQIKAKEIESSIASFK